MMFSRANQRGRLIEIDSDGTPLSSNAGLIGKFARKAALGAAIGTGIFASMVLLHKWDEHNEKICAEELATQKNNVYILIPQYEQQHNYRDAERLENEAWSYISAVNKGQYNAPKADIDNMRKTLNANHTHGASYGEPLN